TRSPRRTRRRVLVSIHARPRASDGSVVFPDNIKFQFTLARERATISIAQGGNTKFQFTLARERATRHSPADSERRSSFNSRSPASERLRVGGRVTARQGFNSRSPASERRQQQSARATKVSIHARPRASDDQRGQRAIRHQRFQFTLARERATALAFVRA